MYKQAIVNRLVKIASQRNTKRQYRHWLLKRAMDTESSFSEDMTSIGQNVSDAWNGFTNTVSNIWNAPRNAVNSVSTAVGDAYNNTRDAIVNAPANMWNGFTDTMGNLGNSMYTGAKKGIYNLFGGSGGSTPTNDD